jgi:hypothetical protein
MIGALGDWLIFHVCLLVIPNRTPHKLFNEHGMGQTWTINMMIGFNLSKSRDLTIKVTHVVF